MITEIPQRQKKSLQKLQGGKKDTLNYTIGHRHIFFLLCNDIRYMLWAYTRDELFITKNDVIFLAVNLILKRYFSHKKS
jgi:uncharacterized ion transporter superfamily protein YfcC